MKSPLQEPGISVVPLPHLSASALTAQRVLSSSRQPAWSAKEARPGATAKLGSLALFQHEPALWQEWAEAWDWWHPPLPCCPRSHVTYWLWGQHFLCVSWAFTSASKGRAEPTFVLGFPLMMTIAAGLRRPTAAMPTAWLTHSRQPSSHLPWRLAVCLVARLADILRVLDRTDCTLAHLPCCPPVTIVIQKEKEMAYPSKNYMNIKIKKKGRKYNLKAVELYMLTMTHITNYTLLQVLPCVTLFSWLVEFSSPSGLWVKTGL